MDTWSSSRSRFGSALVAAMALAVAATSAAPPARERDTFGVIRSDGILIPFASYDNGKWGSNWPIDLKGINLPIALEDVPVGWWGPAGPDASWKALLSSGMRDLKLLRPIQMPIFCTGRLGILTDYRGKPPEPGPTVPKDGLAFAGGAKVDEINAVSKLVPDWRRMIDLITDKFNAAEMRAADAFTNWRHPYPQDRRREFPIVLETLYRTADKTKRGEWSTSYVEAVRRFPPAPRDKGCGLITYVYGWIREQADKAPQIDLAAKVTYCDREGVPFIAPLGRVTLNDEIYWVYQLSSWRDEMYAISRIRPDEVKPIVAMEGGMCTREQVR